MPFGRQVRCFFFQAEDGIRDTSVTGVQTCALPISHRLFGGWVWIERPHFVHHQAGAGAVLLLRVARGLSQAQRYLGQDRRAGCRQAAAVGGGSRRGFARGVRPSAVRAREGTGARRRRGGIRFRALGLWPRFWQYPGLRRRRQGREVRRHSRGLARRQGWSESRRRAGRVRRQAHPEPVRFHLRPARQEARGRGDGESGARQRGGRSEGAADQAQVVISSPQAASQCTLSSWIPNVVISALRSRRGASFAILRQIGEAWVPLISVPLILEYEAVGKREAERAGLPASAVDAIVRTSVSWAVRQMFTSGSVHCYQTLETNSSSNWQ